MSLYVADYLGDTRHLTTEQHGAYLLLLMTMWRSGGVLSDDPSKLARIAGLTVARWKRISDDVMAFFTPCEGGLTQARLAAELTISNEKSEKNAQAGRIGGRAKALKDKKAHLANAMRPPCPPEPEPESKKEKVTPSPKKGCRLPPDWKPSEADEIFALKHNMTSEEISREADQFRDYWTARPGAGGVKLDWAATWRTWCRNRRSPSQAGKPSAGGHRQKPASMVDILLRDRAAATNQPDVSGDGWLPTDSEGVFVRGADAGRPF
jgi:uncharacterized protein YdaU (DUF1376 family)